VVVLCRDIAERKREIREGLKVAKQVPEDMREKTRKAV
jgi:hypothetical protein